ncbi:MAG: DUF2238 domain-containing protein [Campylobacterota bacterium]|nr:DUF2238 domain-containing protein [Campylobacterota bacterium]
MYVIKEDKTPSFYLWITIFLAVFIWSAINPKDYFTWFLEVLPVIMGVMIMAFTYRSFRLTPLLYELILIHMIILMLGGHYTYAEVPLFDWIGDVFNHTRNNYDKVGHFAQGAVPAMIAREILIRNHVVNGKAWLNFIILSICLGLSAFYELIEWQVALISDEAAEAFLGTQGYTWDTQSDMGWALIGVITSLLLFSRLHDRQLKKLEKKV